MTSRKKKILYLQIFLLIGGLLFIFFTYNNFENNSSNTIITKDIKQEIDSKISDVSEKGNVFYNIEYFGIDRANNRYILRAKEAINDEKIEDLLNLKTVKAIFYLKNDKILDISSEIGVYNNKTLDMIFKNNVNAIYDGSSLMAGKAEYLNSKNLLIIKEEVKVDDLRGTIMAEKLIFDLEKNTLDISSSEDKKINANINYK